MSTTDPVEAPGPSAERRATLGPIAERLLAARRVVLTTHVNADGDGTGSEAAVAAWLEAAGVAAAIVNPTPFPAALSFLPHRPGLVAELGTPEGDRALSEADLVLVLDTSEPNRVAPLSARIDPARTIVIDHHPPGPSVVGSTAVQDASAAATGELVYDLVRASSRPVWEMAVVQGIYVALVSDTGSFRFSNTSPRAHLIAAEMISRGVEPEAIFQRLFATFPRRKLELLREALATLQVDAAGIAWMVVPRSVDERMGTTTEDYEGIIDHARSIEGTEVAILFRETPEGETKISFRSNGAADVNRIARDFGGGGHVKAAGALIPAPPEQTVLEVLERVRRGLNGE